MLNFPDAPIANQVFTSGALLWRWDGAKWVPGGASAPPAVLIVSGSTVLPAGYAGFVRVENQTAAPITVTMPVSPSAQQLVTIKDTLGNASLYPITVNGNGTLIENSATVVLMYNFSWVELYYTGVQWVQM